MDQELLDRMLKDYVEQLEWVLRKYPLQWFNYYGFWG
jgi:predicted LPLAT superfamily acyltransferase